MDFTIEELSLDAWPSIKTLVYDGWIIRLAKGYTNRANSVNPLYQSKIKLDEKIEYCETIFRRENLPAVYKILGCDEYKTLDEKLEGLHYKKFHETSVQVCDNIKILKNEFTGITVKDHFDDAWIEAVIKFNQIKNDDVAAFRAILNNVAGEKIIVSKETKGAIAGCGYGVMGRGFVGIFDIVVSEDERGKGYGKEIIKTILSEAGKKCMGKSYLQVMLNNPIALHLYGKLGFKEIYRYWYRKQPV
ncbi:acetyltransferase, GNAT family protein [Spirochaetia bacterium]|nr:acetyltransferase, GNAT family protein [Spirochaetia bacterium]